MQLASVAATAARAETLEEALAAAYRTNPDLKAARRALGVTNEQLPQALAGWRPQVSVAASAGQQRVDTEVSGRESELETTPLTGQLELRQPIYSGGSTEANVERAVADVGAQRAILTDTEQQVLQRTVEAYMNVWRDEAILDLRDNNVEVLRQRLEATQERFEVREVTLTDVSQAESRLSRAISDRAAAAADLALSRAVYEEVVGRPPGELSRPEPPRHVPDSLDALIPAAIAGDPQVRAAEFRTLSARKSVRVVIGQLLPSVSLVGRAQQSENSSAEDSSTTSLEVLAEVSIPLYQSGQVFSRVREAKQLTNQRRLEVRSARRQARRTAISAWENLQAADSQIAALRQQVEAAEVALRGVRLEHQAGERTVLDILDAEQELLNAEVGLVSAQRDKLVALYQALQAIGQLTAAALDLPVEIYDVEARYEKVRSKFWGLGLPDE